MALKFRRGTTAQKSGSLAFGEPYVNTTIGALQIGLESSDITIRSVDSSSALVITSLSASSFVSASSLKVTGNATIDGNLTLGGNITIGDATTDTVTVTANLSSSLIPSVTNTFDLGSSTKIWRDLYLSTGSIKLVDGSGAIVNTITNANIVTTDSIASGSVTLTNSLPTGVVSGSSQITLQSTTGFSAYDSKISTITGSLISSASADRVSITNINTFSGSQLTQNTALATITGSLISSASSFENRNVSLATITGSLISSASANTISITNINTFSGSQLTQNSSLATITGSLILTASNNVQRLTAMEAVSGSWITESETSSFARTNTSNTFVGNQSVTGDLTISGVITANEFHTAYVTSSVMYNSGSNRFGDSADDLQQLIGIVEITGSIKGTQFNNLATITGSLITSASSFESRNASLATITGSLITTASNNVVSITNINTETASLESRATQIGVVTGSLISSASSFESRNASLATITGSLILTASNNIQTLLGLSSATSSYARINQSNTFGNSQIISGNVDVDGKITARFAVSASSVNINNASGNSQLELVNSTTGRGFHLISYDGDSFSIHNPVTGLSTFRIDSGSNGYHSHFFGNVDALSGSISSSVGFSGSINGIGNVTAFSSSLSSQNSSLATITGSLITTASNNVVSITNINTTTASLNTSISNINTFSSSQLTQNSSLATITGSLITTASNNTISVANLNSYTSSLNNAIQLTGSTVSFLGNIVVYGTQSVINSQNVSISDNIIYLAPTASIDNDLGIVGHYNDGTYRHAGIFMDASDGHSWKVFNGLQDETGAQIDTAGTGFTLADFKAGVFTGTSFNGILNGTINATNGVVSGSSQVIGILSSLNTYTGSNDTTNTTQNTRLTALEASASTALSTNNTQDVSITNLNSTTASLNTSVSNLNTYTSSFAAASVTLTNKTISGASNTITNIGNSSLTNNYVGIAGTAVTLGTTISAATIGNAIGAFSGSSQVDLTATTNYASGILTRLNAVGVVSGSSQITLSSTTGYGSVLNQAVLTSSSPTFAGLTINGAITATGDITAYYTSDRRHKNNIQTISNALLKVKQLNGVTWEWNDDVHEVTKSTPKTGLIAQEVQQVLPQVVTERQDGFLALDYSKMMGLMVEAIKEQQIKIDNLTATVEELKRQRGL